MNDAQIIAIVALATAGFLALWLWAIRAAKFPVNAYSGSAALLPDNPALPKWCAVRQLYESGCAGSRRGARCRRKKI